MKENDPKIPFRRPDLPVAEVERESTAVNVVDPIDKPVKPIKGEYIFREDKAYYLKPNKTGWRGQVEEMINKGDENGLKILEFLNVLEQKELPETIIDYRIGAYRGNREKNFNELFVSKNSLFHGVDPKRVLELNNVTSEEELMSKDRIKIPTGRYNPYLEMDEKAADLSNRIENYTNEMGFVRYPKGYIDNLSYHIQKVADENKLSDVERDFLTAIILNESGGMQNIRSETGARGLSQLTKNTFQEAGISSEKEAYQIDKAVRAALNVVASKARSLRSLTKTKPQAGSILRAYNAGQGTEAKFIQGVPYEAQGLDAGKIAEINEYEKKTKKIFSNISKHSYPGAGLFLNVPKPGKALGGELVAPLFEEFQQISSLESKEYEPNYQNNLYRNDAIDFDYGDDEDYIETTDHLSQPFKKGLEYLAYEHEKEKEGTSPEVDREQKKATNLASLFYLKNNLMQGAFSMVEGALRGIGETVANIRNVPRLADTSQYKQIGEDRYVLIKADGSYTDTEFTRQQLIDWGYNIKAKSTDEYAYKLAERVEDWKNTAYYVPEVIQATRASQITQGVGQAVPMLITGAFGRAGAFASATIGFFSNLGDQGEQIRDKQDAAQKMTAEEFVQQGLGDVRTYNYLRETDAEDIVAKMIPGALAAGTIETIGYSRVLARVQKFNPAIANAMKTKLGRRVDQLLGDKKKYGALAGEVIAEGFQGAFEEAMQDAIMNVNAKYVYDFTRSITDGLDDSAIVGGSTQAILTGLLGALNMKLGFVSGSEKSEVQRAIEEVQRARKLEGARSEAKLADIKGETVSQESAQIIAEDRDKAAKKKEIEQSVSSFADRNNKERVEKVKSVSNALSAALGVNVEVVDGDSDPDKRIIDPVSKKRAAGVVNEDGTITIDGSVADENTAIHEFGHIFLDKVKQDNPELYEKLLQEAQTKMPELFSRLQKDYGDQVDSELATRLLEMYAAGKLDKKTGLYKAVEEFWKYIQQLLGQGINKSIRNGEIDFTRLGPNTKLKDLGGLLGDIAYERRSVRGFYGGNNIGSDQLGRSKQFLILDEYQYGAMGDKDALDNLAEAKELEKSGTKLNEIYQLTGWDKDVQGNWVSDYPFHGNSERLYELQNSNDRDLGVNQGVVDQAVALHEDFKSQGVSLQEYADRMGVQVENQNEIPVGVRLSDFFSDPAMKQLIESSPYADAEVRLKYDPNDKDTEGMVLTMESLFLGAPNIAKDLRASSGVRPVIKLYPENIDSGKMASVLLHETQHLLQLQRFAGSNDLANLYERDSELRKRLRDNFENKYPQLLKDVTAQDAATIDQALDDANAYEVYRRFAHEVEARNVQLRFEDPLMKLMSITDTEDVARNRQIKAKRHIPEFYENVLATYDATTDPDAKAYLQSILDFGQRIGAYDPKTGVTQDLDKINMEDLKFIEAVSDAILLNDISNNLGISGERPAPTGKIASTDEIKQSHQRFRNVFNQLQRKGVNLSGNVFSGGALQGIAIGSELGVSTRGVHDIANVVTLYNDKGFFGDLAQSELDQINTYTDYLELKLQDPAILPGAVIDIPPVPKIIEMELKDEQRKKQYQILPDNFYDTQEYKDAFAYFSSRDFIHNLKTSGLTLEEHILSVMKTMGVSRSQAIKALEAASGKKYNPTTDPSQRVFYGTVRKAFETPEGLTFKEKVKYRFGMITKYLQFIAINKDTGTEDYISAMEQNGLDAGIGKEGVAKLKTEQSVVAKIWGDLSEKLFGRGDIVYKGEKEKKSFIGRLLSAGITWEDLNNFAYARHNQERNDRIILMRRSENLKRMIRADELRKEAKELRAKGDATAANRKEARANDLDRQVAEINKENNAVIAGTKSYTGMLQSKADETLKKFEDEGKFQTAADFMQEFRQMVEVPMFETLSNNKMMSQDRILALMTGSKLHPDGEDADFLYPDFEHYVPLVFDDTRLRQDEGYDPEAGDFEKEVARSGFMGLKGTTEGIKEDRQLPLEVMLARYLGTVKRAERNNAMRDIADAVEANNADYESRMEMLDQGLETLINDPGSGLPPTLADLDESSIERIKENRRSPRVQIVRANVVVETDDRGRKVYVDKTPDEVKATSIPFIDREGNKAYMKFKDPNDMMYLGLKNAQLSSPGLFKKILEATVIPFNKYLRAVYTYANLKFTIAAGMRDRIDMQLQAAGQDFGIPPKQVKRSMRKNYRKAMSYLLKPDAMGDPQVRDYWLEAQKAGMPMSWATRTDHKTLTKEIESGIKMAQGQVRLGNIIPRLISPLTELSNRVENTVRLAAYITAREAGLSPTRAAYIGKDITVNFEQKGADETLQTVFSMFLFINPALQGIHKNVKALKNPQQRKMLLTKYALLSAAGAMLFHELGDEDDKKNYILNDWVSGAYSMLPTLDMPIKIPKPYSIARVFMNLGENVVHAAYGYKTQNDILFDLKRDALVTFDPIGGGSPALVNYFPPFLSPLVQASLNRSWLDDNIVKREVSGVPDYLQPNYSTKEEYNRLAEVLYGTLGLDINPSILEYVTEAYAFPGPIGDIRDAFEVIKDDGLNNKGKKLLETFVTERVYSDFTEDQKAYLYNFYDIFEKNPSRGLTQKELEYYFESGKILMKMNKLSPEAFENGIENLLRNYDWITPDVLAASAKRGVATADKTIEKYGFKIDVEGVKEKTVKKVQREIRIDNPIIEKVTGKEYEPPK